MDSDNSQRPLWDAAVSAEIADLNVRRTRLALLLTAVVMPLTSLRGYVFWPPELFWPVLGWRLALGAVDVLMAALTWKDRGKRHATLFGAVNLLLVGASIVHVIVNTGGTESPSFLALIVAIFLTALLVPWPGLICGGMALVLCALYVAAILGMVEGPRTEVLVTNVQSMLTFGALAALMSELNLRSRRAQIRGWLELEEVNGRLQAALAAAREAEQAKSEMFANVSHELRTPLMLSFGPLEAVLGGELGPLSAGQEAMLATARDNALRLRRRIDLLLDLARLDAGKMALRREPVELGSMIGGLVSQFRSAFERKGVALDFTAPFEPVHAVVDPILVDRGLSNLLSNALKFTPSGSVRVRLEAAAGRLRLGVEDTGIGMPPEELPRIFDRFHQVDGSATRRYGGTGLGLALVKELVELHGGTAVCQSEPGRGSLFVLDLPWLVPSAEEQPAAGPRPEPVAPELAEVSRLAGQAAGWQEPATEGAAAKILIVEDDAELAEFIRFCLQGLGRCEWVGDSLQALDRALELEPDCVLCDVMMPGQSGFELARRFKAEPRLKRLPFVLLTARSSREDILDGLKAGADDYLIKPFDAEVLRSKVRVLLRLRRLQAELASAERLQVLAQMAVALNHEINNPLMGLTGALEMLLMEPGLPPHVVARLELMGQMAQRIENVVAKLAGLEEVRTSEYLPGMTMLDLG